MARTLINAPKAAKQGDVIEIRSAIDQPMETGCRPDDSGRILPRDIIKKVSCRYNDELVFGAEMFSAISANPYLAFHTVATGCGTLTLTWEGDHEFSQAQTVTFTVA